MRFFARLHRPLSPVCLLILAALTLSACAPTLPFGAKQQLPVDVKALIPSDWVPLDGLRTIRMDDGGEPQYLLFFRYGAQKGKESQAPIGGVIFNTEMDAVSGMSRLVPQRLLPDFSLGKGQGFLAESGTPSDKVSDVDGDGLPELIITGYGHDSAFPMYLTIFRRWGQSFQVLQQFFGDAGVSFELSDSGQISKIVTGTRLNDRSQLSRRTEYVLDGRVYTPTSTTLGFTYGIPDTPYYPEAAVLAYYLLRNEGQTDLADALLVPEDIRGRSNLSLTVTAADAEPAPMSADPSAPLTASAQTLPLTAFSVPASAGPALPVQISYSGAAVEAEFLPAENASDIFPDGQLLASEVTVDALQMLENGQQVPATYVWRVVNLSRPEDKGQPRWRLLGQQH